MSIVSNASPLIHLAYVGHLDILRALYGEVLIPEAVWQEVVVKGSSQPGSKEVQEADWIKRHSVTNQMLVRALQRDLDAGESEAIVLAIETGAELLLMDERLGREVARYLGVRCIGLVGVLLEAKQKGFIPAIKPLLEALRYRSGFYLSDTLVKRVLQDAGES